MTAFDDADVLVITDIYPAGEAPIPGVHARGLVDGILQRWQRSQRSQRGDRDVRYLGDKTAVVDFLLRILRPGDLVLTLGAGDVGAIGDQVRERLAARTAEPADDRSAEGDRHAG